MKRSIYITKGFKGALTRHQFPHQVHQRAPVPAAGHLLIEVILALFFLESVEAASVGL